MHEVALYKTEALGGEEAGNAEGFELFKQVCSVDFIGVLDHCLAVDVKMLVDHLEIVDPVTE